VAVLIIIKTEMLLLCFIDMTFSFSLVLLLQYAQ